jgi:Clr5 domain
MQSRKATQADWEPHRKELQTLYLTKNMSLKDVMTYMKEKYSFIAR